MKNEISMFSYLRSQSKILSVVLMWEAQQWEKKIMWGVLKQKSRDAKLQTQGEYFYWLYLWNLISSEEFYFLKLIK